MATMKQQIILAILQFILWSILAFITYSIGDWETNAKLGFSRIVLWVGVFLGMLIGMILMNLVCLSRGKAL